MTKAKITLEQAEALEQAKEGRGKDKVMNGVGGKWFSELKPLNDLNPSQMARALYIGYEVEPEFNVGDWVHVSWSNTNPSVHKVIKTGVRSTCGNKNGIEIDWDGSPTPPLDIIRHATPEEIAEEKERRFFARNGRDPWELKEGDVLSSNNHESLFQVVYSSINRTDVKCVFFNGSEFPRDLEKVKQNYKVAYFSHDRKDVDNE